MRHLVIEDEGDDCIDDAEDDQTMDVEGIGTGAGYHGADGEAGIAADGESPQGLSLAVAGDVIDHTGRFGVIDGRTEAAEHGTEEDEPIILSKGQQCQAEAAEDGAERCEPGLRHLIGVIAENRLGYGR